MSVQDLVLTIQSRKRLKESDSQIRERLIKYGFSKKEIDLAFKLYYKQPIASKKITQVDLSNSAMNKHFEDMQQKFEILKKEKTSKIKPRTTDVGLQKASPYYTLSLAAVILAMFSPFFGFILAYVLKSYLGKKLDKKSRRLVNIAFFISILFFILSLIFPFFIGSIASLIMAIVNK